MKTEQEIDFDELGDRVLRFQLMELPGQPQGMHMGTSYLVNDLWQTICKLRRQLEKK